MNDTFVHLHLHTEYSLVDGVVRVRPLVEQVAAGGMPAVAVTDHSNLFGVVKFYRAAEKAGVKPVIGADVLIRNPAEDQAPYRAVLLCQNVDGYRNLARLLTRSQLHGHQHGEALLLYEWLAEYADGLIALSGGIGGDVGQALLSGRRDGANELMAWWLRHFPDRYYLELQRTQREFEEDYIDLAVDLAGTHDCPVVATNDVRFVRPEEFGSHEARVCIHDGYVLNDPRRPRSYTEQQYLKSPEEMCELFSDLPEALQNTVEIAMRCNVEMQFDQVFLPGFPIPDGETVESYLGRQAATGLEHKLQAHGTAPGNDLKVYQERLSRELDVIDQMGYPGYFLIVADFIRWAKENEIPVGPGRGSGAGSLVAYALDITGLDPLRYDLLFERFLNPERVSLPDFDIDFCMEGRDRVIEYVAQRYGHDQVCQIITLGTMAARAVVRDVGRVLGHPYGFVDRIAKMIPFEIGMTLEKALQMDKELQALYRDDDEVNELIDLARSLEGLARNAGKHAGGVVIAPSPLTDFTPLYSEERGGSVVTQFDKDDVEAIGLVKFDFLGLRTLTIIDWAVKTINRRREKEGEPLTDINALPMDDQKAFELLRARGTTGVFQLESRGMKDLMRRMQPDSFEDVIDLVALFRPGPLQSGMVDDYMDRKHGRSPVAYSHPSLEPILKPTHGVILYQEQVMQIAQDLAGYSLGGADLLRRAMGKKKPEEMAQQRAIFVEGAQTRGVKTRIASYIFDLMEKFAGYGFNKSHSAAYALLAYQTAWLKAHYPAEFMAAVLSADMDNTDHSRVVGFGFVEVPSAEGRADALSDLLKHSDFKTKRAATAVSGRGVIVRFLNMVEVPEKNLKTAVRYEADRYIPFDLEEVQLDCQRLEGAPGVEENQMRVLLVAAKRDAVMDQVELLVRAGLQPRVVDVDAFALGNCFAQGGPTFEMAAGKVVALVDIGARKTVVNVLSGTELHFTREVYLGGEDFSMAVAKRFGLELFEAEHLKRSPSGREREVSDTLTPCYEDLGSEIQLSLDYYENDVDSRVEEVFLSGGGARVPDLEEAFERILERRTMTWNPLEGFEIDGNLVDPAALSENAPSLAVAAGLALRTA